MALIEFKDVSISYHGKTTLTDLSFTINSNEQVCILGEIGSGKTMLLRSLAGTAQVNHGTVSYFSNRSEISNFDFYRKTLLVEFAKPSNIFNPKNHFYQQRYHHQMEDSFSSNQSMTLEDILLKKGYSIDDQRVQLFLKREQLQDLLPLKVFQLSSGQRRKLQLILALLQQPEILLLDSPFIGLDAESRDDLNNWLLELMEEHQFQLIMSADERDAPSWINKVIHLPSKSIENTSVDWPFNFQLRHADQKQLDPVLELKHININYGNRKILDNLSWAVNYGEKVALLGKNGSGKSTLLSLIFADNPKAYGNHVRIFGNQRGDGDSIWSVKQRMGFVSSELHLYFTERFNCFKVIATGFFDTKFIPRKLTEIEKVIIEAYAEYVDISHLLEKEYAWTSLGEQKLILFIRALVKNPSILLLDEPYQGFDVSTIEKANKLLNAMVDHFNTTLIFISHYKEEIPSCVDKILYLKDGKIHEKSE